MQFKLSPRRVDAPKAPVATLSSNTTKLERAIVAHSLAANAVRKPGPHVK